MAEDNNDQLRAWTPRPDPTILTTAALLRETILLKELLQAKIDTVETLTSEKFANINTRFAELDRLRSQTAITNKDAIDAALLAQKESTTKTEAAFTKQIDQLQTLITAIAKATDEKIDDVKTRLDLGEGRTKGYGEGWGILVGAGGLIAAALVALSHYIK